jgi:serine phosphatase RsbU (regulator of sigma subunit)
MVDDEKTKEQLIAENAELRSGMADKDSELTELRQQRAVEQAVERVLAEAIAMRSSSDLLKVVAVMYRELVNLGIAARGCNITYINEAADKLFHYVATGNPKKYGILSIPSSFTEIDADIVVYTGIQESISEDEDMSNELKKWHKGEVWSFKREDTEADLREYIGTKNDLLPATYLQDNMGKWIFANVPFEYGFIGFGLREFSEKGVVIVQHFAGALSLGYLRFLDFQRLEEQAESLQQQAEQARRERAVERIRAEAMAMQKSEDLSRVVAVIYAEMINLGIDDLRGVTIGFLNEEKQTAFWYDAGMSTDYKLVQSATRPEEYIDKLNVQYESFDLEKNKVVHDDDLLTNWRLGKPWTFKDSITHERAVQIGLRDFGKDTDRSANEFQEYIEHRTGEWSVTNVPFKEGFVGYAVRQYTQEKLVIVQELASALSLGYVRFLDFQQLEAENERKNQELEEARQLQLSLVPDQTPTHPQLDLAWYMTTATEVGGDYYDYTLTDDGTLTLTLGDATGHGMAAGSLIFATKSLFRNLSHQTDMAETFTAMSRSLKEMNLNRIGMAMNMVKIKDCTMQVSSAGIPPILLYRAATKMVEEILIEGMPLGYSEDPHYEQHEFDLSPGDTLLLMSDGLPERLNAAEKEYGYPAVEALFAEVAEDTPDEIIQRLTAGGEDWADGRPQDDDITLIVLKMKG